MSLQSMDINILLDFLCPSEEGSALECNVSAQLASLESLSSVCSSSEKINYLREIGGINIIWNLCCSSESVQITHSCLFALSCIAQNNIYAQQDLCLEHVFVSLNGILGSAKVLLKTKTLATYLLLSLVSKNKQGQTLIATSDCLKSLMTLFINCSQDKFKSFTNLDSDKFEFFKVVIKTLTYATNVPLNLENQNKLRELLPWIINGVHCKENNSEISQLSCELFTVVVEENKSCQEKALTCRAVEALILLINRLLLNNGENCLGSAVVALNHILAEDNGQQWKIFVSFGGPNLILELLRRSPSSTWMVYHVNQAIMILSKYIANYGSNGIDSIYRSKISQLTIKLMKVVTDDDYFQKMAVHILDFALEPQPTPMYNNDAKFLSFTRDKPFSLLTKRCAEWQTSSTIFEAADQMQSIAETPKFSTKRKCAAYTTILVKKNRKGRSEVTLDISKSSKAALKSSSGIYASPTENVFPYPPFVRKSTKSNSGIASEQRFKKPITLPKSIRARPLAELPFSKLYRNRLSRKLNNSRCSSVIRFSTPKASKIPHQDKLFGRFSNNRGRWSEEGDVISLCRDLIEKEASYSIKKRQTVVGRFGSSGSLIKRIPKASSVINGFG